MKFESSENRSKDFLFLEFPVVAEGVWCYAERLLIKRKQTTTVIFSACIYNILVEQLRWRFFSQLLTNS